MTPVQVKPRNKAVAAPKLNSTAHDKALGLFDCLGIVGAKQRLESDEMTVLPNGISAVICQADLPLPDAIS